MEQKTQPVLCCLCGNEYSDPTQFVMERLFVSANLDWKVITAQIQAESIEEAVAASTEWDVLASDGVLP